MCARVRLRRSGGVCSLCEFDRLLTATAPRPPRLPIPWYNEAHEAGADRLRRLVGGGAALFDPDAVPVDRRGAAVLELDSRLAIHGLVDVGAVHGAGLRLRRPGGPDPAPVGARGRSEERRVGKECRSRWSP